MPPVDSASLHRHPLFSSEAGTALHTAVSSEDSSADRSGIASSSTLSQNTSWSFSPQPSPSSHPSPPYHLPGHSNHPSPSGSAHSPPEVMIGAPPTFYDPEAVQPQTQTYHEWTSSYDQQHQLPIGASSSYAPQPSTADQRPERQAQPTTTRHHNQYQFVPQNPLSTSADAARYNYMALQNQFDDRPPQTVRSHRTAVQPHPQEWSQPPNTGYTHTTTSAEAYLSDLINQYPTIETPDDHQPHSTDFLTPALAVETTLQTPSHISPGWGNPALPSPGTGTSNTPTSTVILPPRRKDNKAKSKRKRQNTETDDDDDDDLVSPGVDQSLSRPTNRLPGACTYCKRLKMKCYFPPGENVCKRCKSGKHDCIVEGRKPRSAPNKREYLLAQMKQKDELIDSLLKQLHNPYLATPLSIEAYRNATSTADQHRQNVIAWLDRLQSSVRSPRPTGSASNPYQLDTRAGKSAGQSDESDEEPGSQNHAQPRRASSGSEGTPVSPNTLVDSEIDPYPDDAVPIGLLASLAISSSRDNAGTTPDKTPKTGKGNAAAEEEDIGIASKEYFMPGPALNLSLRKSLIDKTGPPDILVHKLVSPEDVEKLFDIFYTRINPFITVLEPRLHTPELTFSRCPFLFTVVCAIALRYSDKPEVYPIAMHFAKSAASSALVDGWKSVELCQAYILMSIYGVPARRWEEDRSWLYTGLAIRIATDLNLHLLPSKKPTTEQQELEMLNRTRVWINCFNIDKSTATQFGKPSTVKEDYIVRNSHGWYKSSRYNHPYDVHIIAYTSLFRIINKFHQEVFSDPSVPNGLNRSIDFRAVTLEHDRLLTNYRQEWAERFERDSDHTNADCEFRVKLLPFYANYARLVMFSFGFQKAFQRGFEADDEVFFTRSLESAKAVVTVLVDTLVPTGYIRFAPDGYFVFASFASAFMLKLLRPECSRFITPGLDAEIYQVIERLINTIGSPQIAIDERHTPKLYSRFLASLLAKHKRDGAAVGRMHQQGPPAQQLQTGSSTPVYQPPPPSQQQQQQQPQQQPPSHNASSTSFATGVSGASAPTLAQSDPLNGGATIQSELAGAVPAHTDGSGTGNYILDQTAPDFTFGTQAQQADLMDFTFDTITSPGNDDMLAAMQAIQNPTWWRNMMMPGFYWPSEEQIQDHNGALGTNLAFNSFQNIQPQPAVG